MNIKLPVLFAALAAIGATTTSGATVILGKGGETNFSVVVPANKLMVVRACSLDEMGAKANLISGAATCQSSFRTDYQARYFSGPCTFTFANSDSWSSAVFSYDIIPTTGVQTIVTGTSATLQIPSGKRLRLMDGSYPLRLTITNTTGSSAEFRVGHTPESATGDTISAQESELSGPLTVGVSAGDGMNNWGIFVTYYFATDVVQAAGPSVQSPAGTMVTVEKSSDLQTWQPAFIATETSAPKVFYRLNVVR